VLTVLPKPSSDNYSTKARFCLLFWQGQEDQLRSLISEAHYITEEHGMVWCSSVDRYINSCCCLCNLHQTELTGRQALRGTLVVGSQINLLPVQVELEALPALLHLTRVVQGLRPVKDSYLTW